MREIVCITGANRGLGLGFTEHYLQAGWQVLAVARKAAEKESLQVLQKEFGSQLELIDADVTQTEALAPLQARWREQPLDLLINNAGVLIDGPVKFESLSPEALRTSFEVNVLGPLALTQIALPALKKSQKPRLVMMSSILASISLNEAGGYYAYRASKTALNMLTRSLAVDHRWLTSIALHPGWVQTDMGGSKAPTLVPESIQGMTRVIAGLTPQDSGQFFDFQGKTLAW